LGPWLASRSLRSRLPKASRTLGPKNGLSLVSLQCRRLALAIAKTSASSSLV
jgi:hypothetical protein